MGWRTLTASGAIKTGIIPTLDVASATGTLTVPHGGTGATTLTGVLTGNGAAAVTAVALPADATKFLDGTGAFTVPPGATPTILTARIALSESDLEAMTVAAPFTLIAAQGANTIIIPLHWIMHADITVAYSNSVTFNVRWGTNTSVPLSSSFGPGTNGINKKYHLSPAVALAATTYGTFDPRNVALTLAPNAQLTNPGVGIMTAVVIVSYYVATVAA